MDVKEVKNGSVKLPKIKGYGLAVKIETKKPGIYVERMKYQLVARMF